MYESISVVIRAFETFPDKKSPNKKTYIRDFTRFIDIKLPPQKESLSKKNLIDSFDTIKQI